MSQTEQMREALRREFPLFNETGLDQELHHCEWSIQQERKRLHQLLDELQTKQALSHVNETPKNEHDSNDVLKLATNPEAPEPGFHGCTFSAGSKLVRLTDEDIASEYGKADAYLMLCDEYEFGLVAHAIQNAMQEKNK